MNEYERFYRSLIYHMSTVVPSGITVINGEAHGIRLDDPTGQPPSVTVTIEDTISDEVELGSFSSAFSVIYTVDAQSRMQRDALKYMVYGAIVSGVVNIYNAFDDLTPASGASVVNTAELKNNTLIMRDMPNFDSGRERFFWTSLVFCELSVIGV